MLDRRRMLIANSQQGGGLPDTYQEVEYIEVAAIGTSIAIDITIPSTAKISCEFLNPNISTSQYFWYFVAGSYGNTIIGFGQRGGKYHCYYSNVGAATPQFDTINNQKNSVIYDGDITLNGVTYQSTSGRYREATPLYLMQNNPNVDSIGSRLYSFTATNNGVDIINLVPCYKKSNNEVGLYDTVNGSFYSNEQGLTGYFIAGGNV